MTDHRKTPNQLEVLVLRAEKPRVGFTWELRVYGKGEPLLAGAEIHATQAEARRAGDLALLQFTAASGGPS